MEATYYTAFCNEGCIGITATGHDVSNTIYRDGYRIIAVDTDLIKLHSIVKVETETETFTAIASDTGGAIQGKIVDVLVASKSEAIKLGRQKAKLTILREGK
ncbi:3D domain-containing protein [Metabacillus arenae]|uniref:3D domain-containing protein n=1 Tax=Metabacillus arenae TaxID=2771434 RepID=A0A926RUY7_9BACI|nr:3D domain-containing protein [Metabacillus arenae]MBD1379083.1 hypothetical protein [Metabacillus arenae]